MKHIGGERPTGCDQLPSPAAHVNIYHYSLSCVWLVGNGCYETYDFARKDRGFVTGTLGNLKFMGIWEELWTAYMGFWRIGVGQRVVLTSSSKTSGKPIWILGKTTGGERDIVCPHAGGRGRGCVRACAEPCGITGFARGPLDPTTLT